MKKLARLRQAKGWTEKFRVAADVLPGTEFDELLSTLAFADVIAEHVPAAARPKFEEAGRLLARIAALGDSDQLRRMADALDKIRAHEPNPDRRFLAVLKAYPPGTTITMRALLRRLRANGCTVVESTERRLRRWAEPLGLNISGPPGRPK